jgi:hypothetical protein
VLLALLVVQLEQLVLLGLLVVQLEQLVLLVLINQFEIMDFRY